MMNKLMASTAMLVTSALAQGIGSAIVINQCNYPIYVTNVPASGGGQSQIGPNTLQTGQSYSQVYTELTNGDGWSIKLSKDSSLSQIMQYEYTFHNDGIIWYDLSDVNGDPWGGDWTFTATGDCSPKQTAYQYSTDDAYGMQACPDTSAVTVTLCGTGSSGSTGGSWSSSSAASPAAASTSAAPASAAPAEPAPSPSSSPLIPSWDPHASGAVLGAEKAAVSPSSETSTLATVVQQNAGHTVTNMHTVVVTEYVTASPSPVKRHEAHLHRHMAHHQHF